MTPAQYHLFARLFDAVADVDQANARLSGREFGAAPLLILHGSIAGAALRLWAEGRGRDVVPETHVLHGSERRTWTSLAVIRSETLTTLITVHLDDEITTPIAEAA